MIGTHNKIRMSHSMVDGGGKQRRRRGDRSGDPKQSVKLPPANDLAFNLQNTLSKKVNATAPVKPNVVEQAKKIMLELEGNQQQQLGTEPYANEPGGDEEQAEDA